ncbi:MAG: bifunctional enzyme CysN/CysC [Alphaproteobacteria bacterium]|nr:bifunctional enzyme CysN/CysC [Alphaproteobacteria bacterium]
MNILVTQKSTREQATHGRPLVRTVIVGHVDHGKSTLIGRLLHETGNLPDGKLESLKAFSSRRGMPFEWSFLLDALQTERDQGITLDTSQIRFRTSSRDVVLIDAPGHAEFLRNMITGAAQADAALLMIDAAEGVRDQTRRHGYLLHLLGIHQIAVVVNKMDRVNFEESRFHEIESEIVNHLSSLGMTATAIIPISARNGDGVAKHTPAIAWHTGPTVLEVLERFSPARPAAELPLRIPVQAVYKFDDRRIVAGRVETGRVVVGDDIVVMPRGTTARVQSIEAWPVPDESRVPREADAGQSIGITLDRQVFVNRGDLISLASAPPKAIRRLRARVFWLHENPLTAGDTVTLRIGTAECRGTIALIDNAVDPGLLSPIEAGVIAQNHVGEIEISLSQPIAADIYATNPRTGRVVLDLAGRIAGGGLVLSIDGEDRRRRPAAAAVSKGAVASDDQGADEVDPGRTDRGAQAARLARLLAKLPAVERIAQFRSEVAGKLVFTTSFGLEDQVITHLLCEHAIDVDITTLDTGRLFPETYDLWAETERRYGRRIRAVYPQHTNLEALVEKHGINGFYQSREARSACCYVRKVEPLNRALAGAAGWIVGLRADQSSDRQDTGLVTADVERDLLKLSPLLDWDRDAVQAFALGNQIPTNPLHAKGFASIGCAPCTRAIAAGEPERAGRWWWEQEAKKECGLHTTKPRSPASK